MSDVTRLDNYRNRGLIETLTDLLDRAKRGKLRGLAFSVKLGARRHCIGLAGEYADDPFQALGAASRMQYRANQLMSAKHDEPDTESMPL